MNESLPESLLKLATVLHWLGRYAESNAVTMFARLTRVLRLDDQDALTAFVEQKEKEEVGDAD